MTVSADAVDGWPPTCSSASTSEVNSWPSGMPAKRTDDVGADPVDGERRAARRRRRVARTVILSDERGDLVEQLEQLGRLRAVVERRDQLDRPGDLLEVGLQLGGRGWRRA